MDKHNSELSNNSDAMSQFTAGTKNTATTNVNHGVHAHHKRRGKMNYNNYIHKLFRILGQDMRISKKSVEVMNSFMFDMFDQISENAFQFVKTRHRSTLGANEIEAAAKLVLGHEIFKECEEKYKKCLQRYKKCVEAEQQ